MGLRCSQALLLVLIAASVVEISATTKKVTILHLNDVYESMPTTVDGMGGLGTGIDPAQLNPLLHERKFLQEEARTQVLGGMHHMAHKILSLKRDFEAEGREVLISHAGDFLGPSALSALVTHGTHMVQMMNEIGIDVATWGNHEIDDGMEMALSMMQQSNFPWLLANVHEKASTGDFIPLGSNFKMFGDNADSTYNPLTEFDGDKLPVWKKKRKTDTDPTVCVYGVTRKRDFSSRKFGQAMDKTSDDVLYAVRRKEELSSNPHPKQMLNKRGEDSKYKVEDELEVSRMIVKKARKTCDVLIALTHLNMADDIKLAQEAAAHGGVDAVVGGHDHKPYVAQVNRAEGKAPTVVLKAGSDATFLGQIDLELTKSEAGWSVTSSNWEMIPIRPGDSPWKGDDELLDGSEYEKAKQVLKIFRKWDRHLDPFRKNVVSSHGWKGTYDSSHVREGESAVGNVYVDLMREWAGTDIGILNSGMLRANRVAENGLSQITMFDIRAELPIVRDSTKQSKITGRNLIKSFVASLEKLNTGDFLVFSGVEFTYWKTCDEASSSTSSSASSSASAPTCDKFRWTVGETDDEIVKNVKITVGHSRGDRKLGSGTPIELDKVYTVVATSRVDREKSPVGIGDLKEKDEKKDEKIRSNRQGSGTSESEAVDTHSSLSSSPGGAVGGSDASSLSSSSGGAAGGSDAEDPEAEYPVVKEVPHQDVGTVKEDINHQGNKAVPTSSSGGLAKRRRYHHRRDNSASHPSGGSTTVDNDRSPGEGAIVDPVRMDAKPDGEPPLASVIATQLHKMTEVLNPQVTGRWKRVECPASCPEAMKKQEASDSARRKQPSDAEELQQLHEEKRKLEESIKSLEARISSSTDDTSAASGVRHHREESSYKNEGPMLITADGRVKWLREVSAAQH